MSVALTYDRNGATGGAVPVDATAYVAGVSSVTVKGNVGALTFAGYNINGWNTAANGTGTAYQPGDTFTIAADTTIYAIWDSATSLVTPTGLRGFISTSLADLALQTIIDAEEQEIIDRYGAHATQVEEIESEITGAYISPKRAVLTVTSVVESWINTFLGGLSSTTLDATDHEIVAGGKQIRRLNTGTHPLTCWGGRVKLTYVPVSDNSKRVLALINLCKLDISSNAAMKSESFGGGEYSYTMADASAEREKIFASLVTNQRNFA